MTEGPTLFDQELPAPVEPFDQQAAIEHIAAHAPTLEQVVKTGVERAKRGLETRDGEDLAKEQTGVARAFVEADESAEVEAAAPLTGPAAARAALRSKAPRRELTLGDQVIEHSKQRLKEGDSKA